MKRLSSLWLSFALLSCLSVCAFAAAQPVTDAYTARRWGVEEGLPEGIVTAVNIFSDGFLWLTTPRHVVRFDGAEFVSLSQKDYPANKPRRFNGIIRDRNGTVWVSGEDGIMRNTGAGWETVPLKGNIEYGKDVLWRVETPDGMLEQLPHLALFWVKEAPDGTLWAASNMGMYRFDGESLNLICPVGHHDPVIFTSASMDHRGRIWLVGGGLLFAVNDDHYELVDFPISLGSEELFQVFAGFGGSLWVKCLDGKLFRYSGEEWREIVPPGLRHMALLEQPSGEIWFGAVEGIYRSNLRNLRILAETDINKAHDVRCLKPAADGSLWAGSGNGLFQLKPRTVRMFSVAASSSAQTVTALLPNEAGGFWAGVEDHGIQAGLAGEFRPFKTDPPVLNGATVSAMCMERDKTFWVGTRDDHLWKVLPNGKVDQARTMEGYASRGITALAQSNDGSLWVGTREGLFKMDEKIHLNPVADRDDAILALYADSDNGMWAGTQCSGLWYIDPLGDHWVVRQLDGLPSDTIRALHKDREGRLWLATPGGLALILNTEVLTREALSTPICFTREQGLPFDDIWQMLDDNQGNMWLGTQQRIMRIAKSAMMEVAEGRQKVLTVRTFGREDGMNSGLTGGDHSGPLAVRTQDGALWFATHAGLAMINPAELKDDKTVSKVYIEKLSAQLDGRTLFYRLTKHDIPSDGFFENNSAVVVLPAGCHNITFHYTAPLFVDPEQVLFRTRIDGYDDAWSLPSKERSAFFPRLPPGNYCFRVMVSRPTGGWSESSENVTFTVRPFFWQTLWFLIISSLFSLMAAGIATGLWVRRHEKLKQAAERRQAEERERIMARKRAIEQERIRIARDIHDDLGAGLTQMALLSELAQRESDQPGHVQQRLDHIFRTASTLAKGLNEIVWAVNPKNDTLDSMLTYLENYADEYLRVSGLRFRPDMPVECPHLPVSSMLRHHLFCTMREVLHNAVKYAGPCEVQLKVRLSGTTLTIEIIDTGCGFNPDDLEPKAGKHNGLVNMRNRMKEIDGHFELNSSEGNGTRLKFRVELPVTTFSDTTV